MIHYSTLPISMGLKADLAQLAIAKQQAEYPRVNLGHLFDNIPCNCTTYTPECDEGVK